MRSNLLYCFSQSQASVYKIVEEYKSDTMAQIRECIREGCWEVTASQWVETDKNMLFTESLLRHIEYTRNYLSEVWGVDADSLQIDFLPDTFGHSAFIPEIDHFGGVKYMYHCRALDGDQSLYRWRAPSGRELLVFRGREDRISLWFADALARAVRVDLSGRGLDSDVAVDGNAVALTARPNSLGEIPVTFRAAP